MLFLATRSALHSAFNTPRECRAVRGWHRLPIRRTSNRQTTHQVHHRRLQEVAIRQHARRQRVAPAESARRPVRQRAAKRGTLREQNLGGNRALQGAPQRPRAAGAAEPHKSGWIVASLHAFIDFLRLSDDEVRQAS
ncbi:predicted protein [Micromonas commoda]|uniref:Uncharacterized protein n=1 Tax=Micromonas commoda (strain RCC299 / NOUM17 / CCMP2709) TaxID=296587 RepID=C1EG29_MICCC|nr:predicted protein [Micromonas commoda]ACO66706.1 predicted protein [Micromonas commoda]|eukprot:XP_002505448.1 predicted protein [Micromonas commoda]